MKQNKKSILLVILGLLSLPGLGESQEVMWTVQRDRGWLGIGVDYAITIVGGKETTVVPIMNVTEDSPADAAGVRAGDTITHLNGQPSSQKVFQNLSKTVKPGDLVKMTLLREGRVRDVTVEAGPWPTMEGIVIAPGLGETAVHLDTIQQTILAELNEMRVHIGQMGLDSAPARLSLSFVRKSPADEEGELTVHYHMLEPTFEYTAFLPEEYLFAPDLTLPFEALVARSPAADSLRTRHARLRQDLNEVRRLERARLSELQRLGPEGATELARTDERVRQLREREAQLVEEQTLLLERIKLVSETEIRQRAAQLEAQQAELIAEAEAARAQTWQQAEEALRARGAAEEEYNYSRFYAVGRRLALGAEFKALNPDLAPYFGVEEGVLVTEVVDGTPAAAADLRGGDVIVFVAGESISSVEDLKFGLTYLERPLRIRVIRNREPVEIILQR